MKARIVDIENNEVTVKTEHGKFITIPQKKLKFDCHINQTVTIEKNGDKIYILPEVPSFWGDDDSEPKQKRNNKKEKSKSSGLVKVLAVVLILCGLASIPIVISFVNEAKTKERMANLDTCLSEARGGYLKDQYSKTIECHEKYGGDDADEKINENKRLLEYTIISECTYQANENYKVSEEEINNAGNDVSANLILIKRVGEGYKAQKACYTENGKLGDYSSEISKLNSEISENQSMIEYAESALESQKNYAASRNYMNCTTNRVGSSSYTSCY